LRPFTLISSGRTRQPQSFKVRDRIIEGRQHRDPVAIGGQGFHQRAAEVPDVPGSVHRHQNVHVKYLMAA
jgi:hypothetical protein